LVDLFPTNHQLLTKSQLPQSSQAICRGTTEFRSKILVLCMIIVGAGPAGGTAAYHLASEGARFSLEKKRCHGISRAVVESPAIGQWFDFDFSQPFPSGEHNAIPGKWRPLEAELKTPQPMWMVRRHFRPFPDPQAQKQGLNWDNTEVKEFQ